MVCFDGQRNQCIFMDHVKGVADEAQKHPASVLCKVSQVLIEQSEHKNQIHHESHNQFVSLGENDQQSWGHQQQTARAPKLVVLEIIFLQTRPHAQGAKVLE